MMKFIKDQEQFINEIKEKYGSTKIDSYFNYFQENKTKILSNFNDHEYKDNNSNRQISQLKQDWSNMNMNMNMNVNQNMFQMPNGMMMGFPPLYGNNVIAPNMSPMQFYSIPMSFGLGIPGHNPFIPQHFYQSKLMYLQHRSS